jgi:hypothetical protein
MKTNPSTSRRIRSRFLARSTRRSPPDWNVVDDLPPPRSAWLLLSDEASYPPHRFPLWTASPHIEVGDTLFFYFMAPRKAIHFIGRALNRPYYDTKLEVHSNRTVDPHQWWVSFGGVVEIDPIPLSEINDACGERLLLRGSNGKHIRTDAANRLLAQSKIVNSPEARHQRMALQKVVGRSDLPSPSRMNRETLCDLPSSLLLLESHVEEFIVEPLVRLLRLPNGYTLQHRLRIGSRTADYAVLKNGETRCIIEAKLRTRLDRDRNWSESPDVQQAQGYASRFGDRFLVVDCDEVFCFGGGGSEPRLTFERRSLTDKDIAAIRSHVMASN